MRNVAVTFSVPKSIYEWPRKQNQPKGIDFPKNSKGRSYQVIWYPWLHYDEELDAALCCPYILAHKNKISVLPLRDKAFFT